MSVRGASRNPSRARGNRSARFPMAAALRRVADELLAEQSDAVDTLH